MVKKSELARNVGNLGIPLEIVMGTYALGKYYLCIFGKIGEKKKASS